MSMRIRIIGGIFGLLAGLVLLLNFQTITQEQDQLQEVRLRALAFQEGRLFADRLQNILNQNLAYAEFFKVLLQEDPDMPLEELEAYASYVLEQKQGIASISLAPGGVVTTIFPLAGNEAAIGHDLLNDPERSQYAKEAMERRVPVSQGPVEALQGGLRIFNRSAIYVEKDTGEEFWGFSVIMMDFDALLAESDLLSRRDGFRFALKVEGKGGEEDFFWGSREIFQEEAQVLEVALPDQSWTLGILPEEGWSVQGHPLLRFPPVYYILLAGTVVLAYQIAVLFQLRSLEASRDSLTGALNKRSFETIVKSRLGAGKKGKGVLLLDLNDFKLINDTYGHPAGDQVLREAAAGIRRALRRKDLLCRYGGDEFAIFLEEVSGREDLEAVLRRIREETGRPSQLEGVMVAVSLAGGGALYPEEGESLEALLEKADRAMYQDKARKNKQN